MFSAAETDVTPSGYVDALFLVAAHPQMEEVLDQLFDVGESRQSEPDKAGTR